MRPVNKGKSPYKRISNYGDALPYLEERIGAYCSYCGMRINHVPAVEHVVSKSKGGDRTAWENLLLACTYCNSRKKEKTTPENKGDYLWPHEYNTALAYHYYDGEPKIDREALLRADESGDAVRMAENLFDLVKLGNNPGPKEKDRRFHSRNEAFDVATRSFEDFERAKGTSFERPYRATIIDLAKVYGFFSVWMEVFQDEPEVKRELLRLFPGTELRFFDEDGNVKPIIRLDLTDKQDGDT